MNQSKIILQELSKRPQEWVPMPFLAKEASCYAVNSRVADLRKEGHNIINKVERGKKDKYGNRVTLSYYALDRPKS